MRKYLKYGLILYSTLVCYVASSQEKVDSVYFLNDADVSYTFNLFEADRYFLQNNFESKVSLKQAEYRLLVCLHCS